MAVLFEEAKVNGMTLANRMVRSATWEGMADDEGRPTDQLINYYRDLAEGGIGLLISGYTFVTPRGKQLGGKLGLCGDEPEPEYRRLFEAVQNKGGKIAVQLVHAGGQANAKVSGHPTEAPSAVQAAQYSDVPEEISESRITEIVNAFADAADRVKQWGGDAVELHGAHGYLINQFLSPLTNQREDRYGGSIENRGRFLMEVYQAVRDRVGADYPVMIKLNACDELDGGLVVDDALIIAKALSDAGIDAIEVSSGTGASGNKSPVQTGINKPEKEAYNLMYADKIKKVVDCPVIVVGGFRSYAVAENAVSEHGMAGVSFSRPLIREPGLPARWKTGDTADATCISCNQCFRPGMKGQGIYCVPERKEKDI